MPPYPRTHIPTYRASRDKTYPTHTPIPTYPTHTNIQSVERQDLPNTCPRTHVPTHLHTERRETRPIVRRVMERHSRYASGSARLCELNPSPRQTDGRTDRQTDRHTRARTQTHTHSYSSTDSPIYPPPPTPTPTPTSTKMSIIRMDWCPGERLPSMGFLLHDSAVADYLKSHMIADKYLPSDGF